MTGAGPLASAYQGSEMVYAEEAGQEEKTAVKEAEGTRIDAFGMQAHYNVDGFSVKQFKVAAEKYAAIVGKVQLTELDFKASNAFDGTDATKNAEYTKMAYSHKQIFDAAKELNQNGTKISGLTVWDANGLTVQITVKDTTVDDTDAVTIYVDPKTSERDAFEPIKATVARKDATKTEDGYEAEISVPVSDLAIADTIGMDIAVTNGTERANFNDLTGSQETSSKYYAQAVMKPGIASVPYGTVTIDGEWDDAWEQDSVEVFIDENNHKSESYEEDDKQYRISYSNAHSFSGTKCLEKNVTSETKVTEDGYVVEAAFKWTDTSARTGATGNTGDKAGTEAAGEGRDKSSRDNTEESSRNGR